MIYRVRTKNGSEPVIRAYTPAAAIAAGDVVVLSNSTDTVSCAAAEATAALGWATGDITAADVAAGTPLNVIEANDNVEVEMGFTGTFTAGSGQLGNFYGLAGTTGAQTLDLADADHDLFRLNSVTRNGAASGHLAGDLRAFVTIPSAKSQAIGEA